jgi:hypothetical protein
MIDIKLLYIANVFVNNDIVPNAKNITYFVNEFEDRGFVPTSFKQVINSQAHNRLQLSSPDNEWVVRFLDDRIDIVKSMKSTKNDIGDFDDFCQDAISIWQKINKQYNKTANRIGITSNVLLKEMSNDNLKNIFKKLFIPFPVYNLDNPISWEHELISRIPKKILSSEELINVALNLKRVQGQYKDEDIVTDFDRVQLSLHLNTNAENTEYRFKDDAIIDFLKSVSSWQSELSNSIINHIK